MQASPWLGLGPWLPHLTISAVEEQASGKEHWTKAVGSEVTDKHCCLQRGYLRRARQGHSPGGRCRCAGLSSPDTQDPQESQPGASPGDAGQNELISQWEDSGRWLPNTTARRQTQKLRNTASTTKGTPALLWNYQVAQPAGLSDALTQLPCQPTAQ